MWQFCAETDAHADAASGRNSRGRNRHRNARHCPQQHPNSRGSHRSANRGADGYLYRHAGARHGACGWPAGARRGARRPQHARPTDARAGQLLLLLPSNQRVTVVEGPTDAEGFRWWKVDDGGGNVGWVAESDGETEWLSPRMGEAQPVDRAPRVGDRVQVTMSTGDLSVRVTPGTDAELVTRVQPGSAVHRDGRSAGSQRLHLVPDSLGRRRRRGLGSRWRRHGPLVEPTRIAAGACTRQPGATNTPQIIQ